MNQLSRSDLARFPKADLHLHLEGAILPGDLRMLYPRGRRPPLPRSTWPALYRFNGFRGFLRAFAAACQLLQEPADFGRLIPRLVSRLARQGVRRAEVFVSLPVHLRRGLRGESILEAILEKRSAARRKGVDLGFILDGVRQWGAEALEPCVELARRYREQGVLGIGLGGDESSRRPDEFAPLFRRARRFDLHTVMHVGEIGSPEAIERDLRALEPQRLGHALRAAEDPVLLDHLASKCLPVEVAITGNWRMGLLRRPADHPLPRFLEHGVPVVLATDDPAFFRTTLLGEYAQAQRLFGLSPTRMRALARQSLRSSFAP